jgi:hypothetical protein
MYISGHIDIINDILPDDYFNLKYKNFNKRLLIKGSSITDSACGSYSIDGDHVLFKKRKLCSITALIKLFYEKTQGESELFQKHKGFFAHLHSMSTDPENTVLKIRNKIITSIIGYSLLAIYDNDVTLTKINPNSLWAGIILHTITDSYSPAHTIRYSKLKHYIVNNKEFDEDKKMRLRVHENIKKLAKENILYNKLNFITLITNSDSKRFVNKNKNSLWKSYKVFKFEYDLNKKIDPFLDKNMLNNNLPSKEGDIITFQYYDNQPSLLHMKLDLLRSVDTKLYTRMKNECQSFLNLYKEAIQTGDIPTYLKKVLKLMLEKTYRIDKKYLNNKTNWIVDS